MVEQVVNEETKTEQHLDSLIKEQFQQLSEKFAFEITTLTMRMNALEKMGTEIKWKELLDRKVGREEFELAFAELSQLNTRQIYITLDKHRKEIDNLEVSLSADNFVVLHGESGFRNSQLGKQSTLSG